MPKGKAKRISTFWPMNLNFDPLRVDMFLVYWA